MPTILLAALLLPVLLNPLSAADSGVALQEDQSAYAITKAEVIVDPSKELSVERILEAQKRKTAAWRETDNLNFGYSTARYWVKVPVVNRGASATDWTLELRYPLVQTVHFYQFTNGRQVAEVKAGRLLPFHDRPVDYRTLLFNFSAPKGTRTELYLMLESVGTMRALMTIYTHDALLTQGTTTMAAMGIYFGILLAMALYNFFMFLSIRDRNHLFYVAYVLSFGLLQACLNGLSYQYLWPDWVQWNKISVPVLLGCTYMFLAIFTKSFLETKRVVPRLDLGLTGLLLASVALVLWGIFDYGLFANKLASFLMSFAPWVVWPISLRCIQLGSRPAIYYFIAFTCFFLGSSAYSAKDLSWLPAGFFTLNGTYFGSAAEMILLSLGLAARIKHMKEEKLRSELQAVEAERQLAENRKELEQQIAISTLASQVAHDIRSPLAALDSVLKDVEQLPEAKRTVIRSAAGRIRDIANDLLEKNRGEEESQGCEPSTADCDSQGPLEILVQREEQGELDRMVKTALRDPQWRYIKRLRWASPLVECAKSARSFDN
ncbi:MAG: 7TM diverse intracellular signaling domain-containing protein [Elusimicrobia bacterium]|nr:7TM diverse intracellular signaling domain-containing protein [Elusimicrobiota bacterium]